MKVYLVQHGEAESAIIDPKRSLTKRGREDVLKVANFLKDTDISIDIIWHSTKTRAIETAQLFSEVLAPKLGIEQKEGLAPNDPVEEVLNDILSMGKDIMIVSHLPFLQKLSSLMLYRTTTYRPIAFEMGGVFMLEQDETGEWSLIFGIIPELLRHEN